MEWKMCVAVTRLANVSLYKGNNNDDFNNNYVQARQHVNTHVLRAIFPPPYQHSTPAYTRQNMSRADFQLELL